MRNARARRSGAAKHGHGNSFCWRGGGIRWRISANGASGGCWPASAVGSFVLLLALEIVTEEDEISLLDLLVDAVYILLTISAAVGVALLTQRVHAQHEEKMSLDPET